MNCDQKWCFKDCQALTFPDSDKYWFAKVAVCQLTGEIQQVVFWISPDGKSFLPVVPPRLFSL